jgi:hypothetical protein
VPIDCSFALQRIQGFLAVVGGLKFSDFGFQPGAHQVAGVRVILDDQHFAHLVEAGAQIALDTGVEVGADNRLGQGINCA